MCLRRIGEDATIAAVCDRWGYAGSGVDDGLPQEDAGEPAEYAASACRATWWRVWFGRAGLDGAAGAAGGDSGVAFRG